MSLLNVNHLSKVYDLLKDISFTLKRGQAKVVIGPSGTGILRCINYLSPPTSGEVWLEGKLVSHASDLNKVREKIGYGISIYSSI